MKTMSLSCATANAEMPIVAIPDPFVGGATHSWDSQYFKLSGWSDMGFLEKWNIENGKKGRLRR
jgi:hypothetical protein